jgi:Putative transposase
LLGFRGRVRSGRKNLRDQCIAWISRARAYRAEKPRIPRAQWLEDRQAELLDVPYFHVVFTVPDLIATIAFQNQTVVYDILFRAASETLRTIAADPAHLGAEIGFLGVLHSWGQNLLHHPHIHFLVPGGGIAPNGKSWIACRPGFFLPIRVLSRMFRGLFLRYLEKAFDAGELKFFPAHRHLHEPAAFRRYLKPAWSADCRVGGDVTIPTPHRPGRADSPHPVLHERVLLAVA